MFCIVHKESDFKHDIVWPFLYPEYVAWRHRQSFPLFTYVTSYDILLVFQYLAYPCVERTSWNECFWFAEAHIQTVLFLVCWGSLSDRLVCWSSLSDRLVCWGSLSDRLVSGLLRLTFRPACFWFVEAHFQTVLGGSRTGSRNSLVVEDLRVQNHSFVHALVVHGQSTSSQVSILSSSITEQFS